MSNDFRCKQFNITQNNSGMKVGTDSMLLGSWADFSVCKHILDVGCGTGLLSLMLAQRFPAIQVTAIEIEKGAVQDAKINFADSPFANRIHLVPQDAKKWHPEIANWDGIICNPPYFSNSLQSDHKPRNLARHAYKFDSKDLVRLIEIAQKDNITIALILPIDRFEDYSNALNAAGMTLVRKLSVLPKSGKSTHRIISQWSKIEGVHPIESEDLAIRDEFNNYSEDYKRLTEDFYLGL